MIDSLLAEASAQQPPSDVQRAADQAEEDHQPDGDEVDVPEPLEPHFVRLSKVIGNVRKSPWHVFFSRYRSLRIRGTDEIMVWPPCPEKIEFVSDGTMTMPTQNVAITATACRAYTPYSAEVIVGGSVVT